MSNREQRLLEALKEIASLDPEAADSWKHMARCAVGIAKGALGMEVASYEQGTREVMYTEDQMYQAFLAGSDQDNSWNEFIATQRSK